MKAEPLTIRQPQAVVIGGGLLAALLVHGLVWFIASAIFKPLPAALSDAMSQATLGFWWMTATILLWGFTPPKTRAGAVMTTVGACLLVALIGSVSVAVSQFGDQLRYGPGLRLVLLGGVLLLHALLAVPAALALQWSLFTHRGRAGAQ